MSRASSTVLLLVLVAFVVACLRPLRRPLPDDDASVTVDARELDAPVDTSVPDVPPQPDLPVDGVDARPIVDVDATVDARTDTASDLAVDVPLDRFMDASTDRSLDVFVAPDGARVCPETVVIGDGGVRRSAATGALRECFPGELRCFCDLDDDCFAGEGYVPCFPLPSGATPPAPPTDVSPVLPPSDASVLAPDPVAYSGSFATRTGYQRALITVAGTAREVWVYNPPTRGSRPPLLVLFHGAENTGPQMMQESDGQAFGYARGIVVVAPTARVIVAGDFNRPLGNARYWETANNTNPDSNPDVLLARAIMRESQVRLGTDPDHVYIAGFSSGGFMSVFTSVLLRDRVAAFAESSAGVVPCTTRADCAFVGSTYSCAELARQAGYCACTGADKPVPLPMSGLRRPGFLWHAAQDPTVSVYYTCTLDARMLSLGIPHETTIWMGGHTTRPNYLTSAWPFFSRFAR